VRVYFPKRGIKRGGRAVLPPTRPALITDTLIKSREVPGRPKPEQTKQRGCRLRSVVMVLVGISMICLLVVGSLLAWAYATDSVPVEIKAWITYLLSQYPLAEESIVTATPIPTMTPTPLPGGIDEPDTEPEATPPIGVTPLSSSSSSVGEVDAILQKNVLMVHVPGGTFTMGNDSVRRANPAHTVTISAYYIDKYEITNAEWDSCVKAGKCSPPGSERAYDGTPYYDQDEFGNYPVVFINWQQASDYCEWRAARLPTEAEWEMATRWDPDDDTVTQYPWGDDPDPALANFCDAGCLLVENRDQTYPTHNDGWPQMAEVGSFPEGASPVGALDMAGNVAEWVADWFGDTYYALSPPEDPTGPDTGSLRIVRGGAWGVSLEQTRSTGRAAFDPDTQIVGLGARCAISAEQVETDS
jgi:formylglycine-generating enzyme required for sulfatase activity